MTRPVNALMLMRYDNLDRNTSDRGGSEQALNYFETIMHLNPLPPSAAALAMENELADFSAEVGQETEVTLSPASPASSSSWYPRVA